MAGFDVSRCHGCGSRTGACAIERLREWLVICCDVPGIRFWQPLGRGRVGGRAVLAMCVSNGCLWVSHGEGGGVVLFWEGHESTSEGIVHPSILIYDRVSSSLM